MNIEESLQKLGLTANEITIYIYLLRAGICNGSMIYKDNELDKSSAYEALSNLSKKGLIYAIGQSRNQKFGAIPADKLYELYLQKERELSQIRDGIGNFIKNIEEYSKQSYRNKNIRIIDGKDGFKKWAWARLDAPKGSIIRDLSTDELQQSFTNNPKEYAEYSIQMPLERTKRGIYMHGFMKKSDIEKEIVPKSINKSNSQMLKEVRLLPEDINLDASIVTFGNNTSFLRKKDTEFFGVIIDDKFITNTINSIIDFIWDKCEKV
jgi:sugar-specific transcriptional regulator TrmB